MWGHASSSYMPASCSVGPGSVPGQVDVGFVVEDLGASIKFPPEHCQHHSTSTSLSHSFITDAV